jgi:hypothetical protein
MLPTTWKVIVEPLIDEEASNTPNSEAVVQMAEALNPIPDRDIAARIDQE